MAGFFKQDDEKEKLGKTISNLSEQIGALQQQLLERNKQIDELTRHLQDAQEQQQSTSSSKEEQQQKLAAAQKALREAQAQTHELERQLSKMKEQETHSKSSSTMSPSQPVGASGLKEAMDRGAAGNTPHSQPVGASGLKEAMDREANKAPAQPATTGLTIGGTAWVQQAGGKNLRRHDAPGLNSKVLDGLAPGTQLTLLEGPRPMDGHAWWHVRAADGREGWVAGEELVTKKE